jgi:hypothetical protein
MMLSYCQSSMGCGCLLHRTTWPDMIHALQLLSKEIFIGVDSCESNMSLSYGYFCSHKGRARIGYIIHYLFDAVSF